VVVLLSACSSGGDVGGDTDTAAVDSDPGVDSEVVETDTEVPVDTDDTDVVEPSCRLGWGETEFHPLTDGEDVPVIRGLQGRWHVPGAVICQGIDPGRSFTELGRDYGDAGKEPAVWWRVLQPDLAFLGGYPPDGSTTPLYRPMKTDDGAGLLNERLVLWTNTYEDAVGRDAVMSFALTDKDGVHVEASVAIHLVDPSVAVDTDTDAPADTDAAPDTP
jgi:hypothetical protein